MNIRKNVRISGLVQGVNFRYYTQQEALRLGVTGWVKNLPDGDVEGCFEGSADAVESLIDWCRKGPARARVDGIEVKPDLYRQEFTGFHILR